ncbi:protein CWC15 homolog [Eupeodes corollae]|uniref:protein CWC15 homolog n=1 Tax=Eupeodes corollae TaxID=290404 RepID=UPI0024935BD7|nr:protein CWC15 homolog [Eupeodes corollae]
MTTAARPTFDPARGGTGRGEKDLSALSKQYSSRDLPGHTKLKYREPGQGTSEELRNRDFRKELEEREREARPSKNLPPIVRKAIEANNASSNKRAKLDNAAPANLDADDPVDNDSSDEDSDSEDDTATLLAELNKIKEERLQENARKEQEKKQEDERIRMENILSGNPLINYAAGTKVTGDLKVKRRWDDDVVFKNCARTEPEKKSHFINDSLRSEFHKKFMEKYIK